MLLREKRVKDKRITLEGIGIFLATVEYYQDRPDRDEDEPDEKTFKTVKAAQTWLRGFPRDIWDGFASHDFKYVEQDERNRNGRKKITREVDQYCETPYKRREDDHYCGRTLVGCM